MQAKCKSTFSSLLGWNSRIAIILLCYHSISKAKFGWMDITSINWGPTSLFFFSYTHLKINKRGAQSFQWAWRRTQPCLSWVSVLMAFACERIASGHSFSPFSLGINISFLHYLLFDQKGYFSIISLLMFIFHIVMCTLLRQLRRYYETLKKNFWATLRKGPLWEMSS